MNEFTWYSDIPKQKTIGSKQQVYVRLHRCLRLQAKFILCRTSTFRFMLRFRLEHYRRDYTWSNYAFKIKIHYCYQSDAVGFLEV